MNIAHWLARSAAKTPTSGALFDGTQMVADYGSFHERAARLAAGLITRGIQPGDRVGIFMKNRPDYLIAFYGVLYAGGVVVPINAKLHGREVGYILDDSGASLCLISPELKGEMAALDLRAEMIETPSPIFDTLTQSPPIPEMIPRAPTDIAWLFYTSGTTGKPKGVMITHQMLMAMALSYEVDADHVTSDHATLYAAPLSHGAGIYNLMHVRAGARHVFPPSGGFDCAEIFDLAAHFGNTHMFAAPTMVKRMTEHAKAIGQAGTGLRTIVYAGGPMYVADIIDAVDHFGPIFVQIYGQGECPMAITALSRHDVADRTHPDWQARLASVGQAQSVVEVQIGDETGQGLPVGAHGEIMVRGQAVMPGYWNNPEATAKTLVNGWLMTGDMGFMDAAGYVTLQDRSKDMIITGGSNVYPREVEEVLMMHSDIIEASVVGHPHPEWGEQIVAFIVGNASEVELDQLCLANIARFKRPKSYVRIAELPKNNYGKVLKTELRKMLATN